ncbi:MAG: hypothetical protein PSV16_14300 [Flavobacterium sp.]|nr:hypothetical protein [Flavobacterium sp.]
MKKYITISILFFSLVSFSQQVQWASKLIKFSSDLGGKQNGIKRILGKPDAFPQGGPSPNAWCSKNALDGKETVVVGFDTPQTVKQVAVFENLNAGCVLSISADNGSGKFQVVWSKKTDWKTYYAGTFQKDRKYYFGRKRRKVEKAPEANVNPGIEYAILENAMDNVVAIKVEFNFAMLPGQKQVDAIGIADTETPIQALINTKPEFESLPMPQSINLEGINPANPALSEDGQQLFITSMQSPKDEIFSFTKDASGNWTHKTLQSNFNTGNSYNYIDYCSADFILKGGKSTVKGTTDTGYEIFKNNNGNYESTGNIQVTAYNNYDDTNDATISKDGKVFIMGIETDFTQGGSDLYFAFRRDDGTYGFLQNMGKIINSAADEGMAQLLSDQKTLLFSSNGFSSYGDYDIYVSYRLDDTWKNWSPPINLGSKVNSNDFDGMPFYSEKEQTLYYITAFDGNTVLKSVPLQANILLKEL